ncbi:hypothetical protein GCM10007159_00040 [Modicisalibacter luteus]|nr:hypothetical protein GCM10007159_00040 [Halomonas lutea]
MATYLVVFDLLLPQEYEAFCNQLQVYPCKHVTDTCYLIEIEIEISSEHLRDKLMPLMGERDRVFIARIGEDWASAGTQCGSWLSAPERELI